jgi:hypothetical protein
MLPISNSRSSGQRRRQLTLGVWLAIASAPGWCAVADSAGADADSEHGGSGVSLAALDLSAFGASAHDFDMAEAADPDGGTPLYLDVYFDERPAGRLVELRRRGGRLYITPQGLTALDVVPPQPLQPGADGYPACSIVTTPLSNGSCSACRRDFAPVRTSVTGFPMRSLSRVMPAHSWAGKPMAAMSRTRTCYPSQAGGDGLGASVRSKLAA